MNTTRNLTMHAVRAAKNSASTALSQASIAGNHGLLYGEERNKIAVIMKTLKESVNRLNFIMGYMENPHWTHKCGDWNFQVFPKGYGDNHDYHVIAWNDSLRWSFRGSPSKGYRLTSDDGDDPRGVQDFKDSLDACVEIEGNPEKDPLYRGKYDDPRL